MLLSVHEGSYLWIPQSEYLWRPAVILNYEQDGKSVILEWLDSKVQAKIDLKLLSGMSRLIYDCEYDRVSQIDLSGLNIINEPEGILS